MCLVRLKPSVDPPFVSLRLNKFYFRISLHFISFYERQSRHIMNGMFHLEQIVYKGTNDMRLNQISDMANTKHNRTKQNETTSFLLCNNNHGQKNAHGHFRVFGWIHMLSFFFCSLHILAYDSCNIFCTMYGHGQRRCERPWKMNHKIKLFVRCLEYNLCVCLFVQRNLCEFSAFYYCVLY